MLFWLFVDLGVASVTDAYAGGFGCSAHVCQRCTGAPLWGSQSSLSVQDRLCECHAILSVEMHEQWKCVSRTLPACFNCAHEYARGKTTHDGKQTDRS